MTLQTGKMLLVVVVLSLLTLASTQQNQGVRLAESPLGLHAGRVEVKYNGRWGTICEIGWSGFDAGVVCRMLNYTDDICAVRSSTDVFGEGTGNVWLTNLQCGSRDENLDDCRNSQPQNTNPCSHDRDAALICQDPSIMPVPYEIRELNRSTRSIKLGWKLRFIPPYVRAIDFRLNMTEVGAPSTTYRTFLFREVVTEDSIDFNYTITSLALNTSYNIRVRAEGEYQWCPYNELVGKYSAAVVITTLDTVPPSTLPIRLVSPDNRPYVGRLQVQNDGQWGNVCDDYFSTVDANVACWSLNYTDGAICYATSPFPLPSAPIHLDDVDCSNADRFEDCFHRGWGVHNCFARDSIGLVCNPGPDVVPVVTGLRVAATSPSTISLEWDALPTIPRYTIWYQAQNDRRLLAYVRSPSTTYTLRRLQLGSNYSINITAGMEFRNFRGGTCFSRYLYGESSGPVYAVPQESAPTIAISQFHVSILNSTAVEVTWSPPSPTAFGVNGVIRGYKLFVDKVNGTKRVINITDTASRVYLLTDLEQSATYRFGIVMYTVADGPMSVKLTVIMPNASFVQLITKFGVYGDGLEVRSSSIYRVGFNVLCGSSVTDTTFEWIFANGNTIGISNPGFRAAHFENGTAVLQIGTARVIRRRLTVCDGGVYTCVATSSSGKVLTRNFSLYVGSSQPALDAPRPISKGSTWIQIGWDPLDCDGGYPLSHYIVQYRTASFFFSFTTAEEVSAQNYTLRMLSSNSEYEFRIGRATTDSSITSYSRTTTVLTLESGPSPPRSVTPKVVYNGKVCVTWRPPATPIGVVILYKLYAERVDDSQAAVDAVDLSTNTVFKTFPGRNRTGCIELGVTGVIYHFQMSAVAVINGDYIEGSLSPFSETTTIFVPLLAIPVPEGLNATATNTSVTLQWKVPGETQLEDAYFNVSYSGVVEWTSPAGVYTGFLEQGWMKTDDTSLTFSPLSPSTKYTFRVGVVNDNGQQGMEASATVTTKMETGAKLAYFQVRIQDIGDCDEWVAEDGVDKLSKIKDSLETSLIILCQCQASLSQAEFSCRIGPSDTVTYRARIIGTSSRSASDVTAVIRDWVKANNGSVKIDELRFNLDPTCDPSLENIHGPDCSIQKPTTKPMTKPTTDKGVTEKGVGGGDGGNSSGGASAADVVGVLLGALVVGLLIALVAALVVIIFLWTRKQRARSFKNQSAFSELENEPGTSRASVVFAEDDKL